MIVSDATSHPEQVEYGEQGLLVRPGEWTDVAEAICLLAGDAPLRMGMGKAARLRVTREFNSQQMIERYDQVLRRTVETYRSERRA